jgi:hypothetical protein
LIGLVTMTQVPRDALEARSVRAEVPGMQTVSSFRRAHAAARISRRGRMPVLVGLTAGLSFLFVVGAILGAIEAESAIRGGALLAGVGGIGAFLSGE